MYGVMLLAAISLPRCSNTCRSIVRIQAVPQKPAIGTLLMGNPYLAWGPDLAVAVPIVAETLTQAQNQPHKVSNEMRAFSKNLS